MPLYRRIDELEPIVLQIQLEPTRDALLREYLAEQTAMFEGLVAARRRCVAVMDNSLGDIPNATQRSIYAEWINASRPLLDQALAGAAFVVPSMMVRGSLTAIFWLARLSSPHTVHKDLDAALAWALAHAETSGLALDPRLARDGVAAFAAARAPS